MADIAAEEGAFKWLTGDTPTAGAEQNALWTRLGGGGTIAAPTFSGTATTEELEATNIAASGKVTAKYIVEGIQNIGTTTSEEVLNGSGRVKAILGADTDFTLPDPTIYSSIIMFLRQDVGETFGAYFDYAGPITYMGGVTEPIVPDGDSLCILSFASDGTDWYCSKTQP